jgi:hypothetical protein
MQRISRTPYILVTEIYMVQVHVVLFGFTDTVTHGPSFSVHESKNNTRHIVWRRSGGMFRKLGGRKEKHWSDYLEQWYVERSLIFDHLGIRPLVHV